MKLTHDQIAEYRERGFLMFPSLVSADELKVLSRDLTDLVACDADGIIKETTGAVRSVFRVHSLNGPTGLASYDALARIPRILGPIGQLLEDEQVYVYHTKCNLKAAIQGEIWQWHQDFGYWQTDGVRAAEGMATAMLMLSEATEIGGCLYFIPGSHKHGRIDPTLDETTTSYKLWTVPKSDLISMMERYGDPVPIVGEPGTVVIFHPHIVHGSGHNMSRYSRWHVYTVYNRSSNKPVPQGTPRPEWVVSRDYTPITMGSDADILETAGSHVRRQAFRQR